ncbi:MAG: hypothetical protein KBD51_02605 [Candidatus Levybacteria bacterium]|nr:hypothetical protein [Candidatus Levybacteria bacterium]
MAGPTLAERQGLAPQEPRLDGGARKSAVQEINDAVAARAGITQEQRAGYFTGKDGFEFDGRRGIDLTRVTLPGALEDGSRYIIRTFYSGKGFNEPAFEVIYPANFKNPGTSTQTALDQARSLLNPPKPSNQP